MPRQARMDAPEVLHHIMIRGIERRKIFVLEGTCPLYTPKSSSCRYCDWDKRIE